MLICPRRTFGEGLARPGSRVLLSQLELVEAAGAGLDVAMLWAAVGQVASQEEEEVTAALGMLERLMPQEDAGLAGALVVVESLVPEDE